MISIIIPVYNASKYLPRCLDSVLMQSYTDWEAILVDDGSSDDSGEICDRYARLDARLQVTHKVNGGVSAARNTGLSQAKGEWIFFIDADDFLPEHSLLELSERAEERNPDIVIGGYEIYDESLIKTYEISERVLEGMGRDSAISMMYKPKYYRYLGYVWGKLFKADMIRENNIQFNSRISFNEDRLFVTEYLSFSNYIILTTEPIYCYFEHSASAMASLEQGFNEKFFSDMDAMILMKDIVSTRSPANLLSAERAIASSYWRIQRMMNRFKANSMGRLMALHWKLLSSLSLTDYFRLIIRPCFQIVSQKINRSIHHEII